MTDDERKRPGAWEVLKAFTVIGLTSFGGGLSGRVMSDVVHKRQWLDEEEFLNGLAISQALPGVNVKNLAIWIGYKLCGLKGALAGFVGIILPPAVVIVLLAVAYAGVTQYPMAHVLLGGAAAAAIGLSLSMAATTVRRLPRRAFPLAVFALTFAAIFVMHWPVIWVVLVGGTASVAVEFARAERA